MEDDSESFHSEVNSEAANNSVKSFETRSNIRPHTRIPLENEPLKNDKNRKLYYCKYCEYVNISTTNFKQHLRRHHGIDCDVSAQPSVQNLVTLQQFKNIYNVLQLSSSTDEIDEQILQKVIQKSTVKKCLVELVTSQSLSISVVTWPEFQRFCKSLNSQLNDQIIPQSYNTLRSWIQESFRHQKASLKELLGNVRERIHLSVDVWTSPNNILLMAICGHFIAKSGQLVHPLLGLRPIDGHSGVKQFEQGVLPVLLEYGIVQKIGVIMGDNSGTNDVLCHKFSEYLRTEHPRDPEWIASQQRLRCLGHILNLVIQAFMFPDPDIATDLDDEDLEHVEDEDEGRGNLAEKENRGDRIRRDLGALGKLHNVVVFIRSSPQRLQEFTSRAGRRIPLNNDTRWKSWFTMLDAIFGGTERTVEISLHHFLNEHKDALKADCFTMNDWSQLKTIYGHLTVFHSATKLGEGDQATLEKCLDNMDIVHVYLLEQQKSLKKSSRDYKFLAPRIDKAIEKLEKYYKLLESSPYYSMALILHPLFRRKWLEKQWDEDRSSKAIHFARLLWERFRDIVAPYRYPQEPNITSNTNQSSRRQKDNEFQRLKERRILNTRPRSLDEYDDFCNEATFDPHVQALHWWQQEGQQKRWPRLSILAHEILSIPAMSAEPERVFSCGRRSVRWDRERTSAETLEMLECHKNWIKYPEFWEQ